MNKNKWMMNKAGLINFWYYDEEEFDFSDGKLLLRGSNGSGKSVTMQSLIPLLLDGNKSPERLDPFRSRARKLEDYLLGEAEYGKEESTGYIYIEFKKENSNNYLTIGMGVHAKRGKGVNSWGFAINDGRRIGKDIFLYKNIGSKICLSKIELKNKIGNGGEVKEAQKEYMAMVNKYLFGFDNIEDYDELIKLLIQIRTPKLSKEFKPTVIYEIMNDSLQPLSDEDLRPMSEAIENMDNIKTRLEEFKSSKRAADGLNNAYDKYNRYILLEKTKEYLKSQDTLEKLIKEEKELNEKKDKYEHISNEEEKNLEQLEIKRNILEKKKQELEKHDSYNIKEKISELEQNIEGQNKEVEDKNNLLDRKKEKERDIHFEIKQLEDNEYKGTKDLEEHLENMDEISLEFAFDEQDFMKDELLKDITAEYDFSYIKTQIKNYGDKIINAKKSLEEENRINKEYDDNLKDLDKCKREKEDKKRYLDESEGLFLETKEEFIEKVYLWSGSNKELKPSNESLIQVGNKVNGYGDSNNYDDIIGEIRREYNNHLDTINAKKHRLIVNRDGKIEELEEKNIEVKSWRDKKDPEPRREEKVIVSREKLKEANIPYIPFYMAVDFKDDLSEEEKGRLEEALIDMGILDALIIPKEYKNKVLKIDPHMADKYIFASPKYLAHELSYKLKADKINIWKIKEEDIENVLKTILIDGNEEESTFISENGYYGIGPIRGKTSSSYISKYIGAAARKKFREETIEKLEIELEEIKAEIEKIDSQIKSIEMRINTLNSEYSLFPDKKDLETAFNQVREYQYEFDNCIKNVEVKEKETNLSYKRLQEARQRVHNFTLNIEIPKNLSAYIKAEEALYQYKDSLSELETKHLKLIQLVETKNFRQREWEEIQMDIDDINYDLEKIKRKIVEDTQRHKSLLEQLEISGFKEIEEEINSCIENLKSIPKLIEKSIRLEENAKSNYKQTCIDIENIKEDLELQKKIDKVFAEGFKEEYLLGFIFNKELDEDLYQNAKRVYMELKYIEKENRDKDSHMTNLQEKFHENRQYLIEYNLKMDYIFDKFIEEDKEENTRNAIIAQKRLKIEGRVRGKYVDFFNLLEYIKEGIEENEKLLRESDRQLFEDILAKNISKKIRAKIYHSEAWVKKMNSLMESMNTSSGLSFSLRWKSKSAESEEQLDTKELVSLLRKDGGLLTEVELGKLSSHFRSKINEARMDAEERDKMQTFHKIMKDILDYRKWFEFTLYFRKTNENKKELTNNAFYKFSGGEKAMAMYVPLFSAVYAKYEGARGDCPRIVSLDEAFAGVDELNIRDMFRLLSELELNFIINSQILWGDYDTVSSLSICELLRPNNANFVTVLRYKWNGKVKELITDEDALDG